MSRKHFPYQVLSAIFLVLIYIAGLPPTTIHGSTSLKTAALAPTTAPSPMMIPGAIKASAATHTLSSMIIGFSIC